MVGLSRYRGKIVGYALLAAGALLAPAYASREKFEVREPPRTFTQIAEGHSASAVILDDRIAVLKQSLAGDPTIRNGINQKYPGEELGNLDRELIFGLEEVLQRVPQYSTINTQTGIVTGSLPFVVVESGMSAKATGERITVWPLPEQVPCYREKMGLLRHYRPFTSRSACGAVIYPTGIGRDAPVLAYFALHTLIREKIFEDAFALDPNVIALPQLEGRSGVAARHGQLHIPGDDVRFDVLLVRLRYDFYQLGEVPELLSAPCPAPTEGFRKP